jgi:hypothetical protein
MIRTLVANGFFHFKEYHSKRSKKIGFSILTTDNPNQNGVPELLVKNAVKLIWPGSVTFPSRSESHKQER